MKRSVHDARQQRRDGERAIAPTRQSGGPGTKLGLVAAHEVLYDGWCCRRNTIGRPTASAAWLAFSAYGVSASSPPSLLPSPCPQTCLGGQGNAPHSETRHSAKNHLPQQLQTL